MIQYALDTLVMTFHKRGPKWFLVVSSHNTYHQSENMGDLERSICDWVWVSAQNWPYFSPMIIQVPNREWGSDISPFQYIIKFM